MKRCLLLLAGMAGMADMESPVDGIFRALASQVSSTQPSGIAQGRGGRWVVTLNLEGEWLGCFSLLL